MLLVIPTPLSILEKRQYSTQLFVIVSPQDPVEIRRVTLTNLSQHTRDIQLTSYLEVVLDRLAADTAHPAFSKLFIQTGYERILYLLFAVPESETIKNII